MKTLLKRSVHLIKRFLAHPPLPFAASKGQATSLEKKSNLNKTPSVRDVQKKRKVEGRSLYFKELQSTDIVMDGSYYGIFLYHSSGFSYLQVATLGNWQIYCIRYISALFIVFLRSASQRLLYP